MKSRNTKESKGGLIIVFVIILFHACAVIEAPSGGPQDKTPPFILNTVPSQDSTNVPKDSDIIITFSEDLDPESFKNRIHTYPSLDFKDIDVDGEVLKVNFDSPLPETTIVFHLESGFQDNHRVKSGERLLLYFTTANYLERGLISGWTLFKQKPDSLGVVKLFKMDSDTIESFIGADEARVAYSNSMGEFLFKALPTDSTSFILWAFSDRNGDGKYSKSKDFAIIQPDTVILTEQNTMLKEVRLNVIDPNEPGLIEGRIINATGIAGLPTVILEPISPEEKRKVSVTDSLGAFKLKQVPPGRYLLTALMDIIADSTCGTYPSLEDSTVMQDEPCFTLGDTISLKPAEKMLLESIKLE
jgi:hypothetical protein